MILSTIHPLMLCLNLCVCFTITSIGVGWLLIAKAVARRIGR